MSGMNFPKVNIRLAYIFIAAVILIDGYISYAKSKWNIENLYEFEVPAMDVAAFDELQVFVGRRTREGGAPVDS